VASTLAKPANERVEGRQRGAADLARWTGSRDRPEHFS
jgi:hypothetical protein